MVCGKLTKGLCWYMVQYNATKEEKCLGFGSISWQALQKVGLQKPALLVCILLSHSEVLYTQFYFPFQE